MTGRGHRSGNVARQAPDASGGRHVRRPDDRDLRLAAEAVRAFLRPSPLIRTPRLSADAWIKVESLQPTGSFKPRGAIAALMAVPPKQPIVLSSAGNAAVAVAWAARRLDRRVHIVVPATVSPAKLCKMRDHGATIESFGDGFDEAEEHALSIARSDPACYYLSSYNDTAFISGLATIGDEIANVGEPTAVVVPVGGGGLASGVCTWAAARPEIRVIGVQVANSPAMGAALAAGGAVPVEVKPTLAEGLAGNIEPGSVTVDILADRLDDLVEVGEDDIAEAIRFLAAEHCLIAEGAGAVATAALLRPGPRRAGRTIAILSGGNIASPLLAEILT